MSDEGDKTCPLCAEEMDLTDQQLKPCKCGYEICVWCWHHIMDMAEKDDSEGRCPACRSLYDKEKIVGMAATCERLVSEVCVEKKKSQKAKAKPSDGRKQLSSVRVIQRNLVYIVGLPLNLADEDILQQRDYFGQYGKVLKVSMSRTAAGVIQQFPNNTCSVYITYAKEEEAVRCIQSVHGFVLDGRALKACFGTTKYCHAWLRNVPCTNPDCLYLHEVGCQEDSFTKDEIISAYTRNRVQQITGSTTNTSRRAGNILPPPLDDYSNPISAERPIVRSASNVSVTERNSPPNGTVGKSIGLPAAASWGIRASSSPHTVGQTIPSGSTKQKVDPAFFVASPLSSSLPSSAASSLLHNDRIKAPVWNDDSHMINDKGKPDTARPMQRNVTAEEQSAILEKPTPETDTVSPGILGNQLSPITSTKFKERSAAASQNASISSINVGNSKDGFSASGQIRNAESKLSSIKGDTNCMNGCVLNVTESSSSFALPSYGEQGDSGLPVSAVNTNYPSGNQMSWTYDSHLRPNTNAEVEEDVISFDNQRLKDPEVVTRSSFLSNSYGSFHAAVNNPRSHSSLQLDAYNTANSMADSSSADSAIIGLYNRRSFGNLAPLNGFSNSDGNPLSYGRTGKQNYSSQADSGRNNTFDVGESNIISDILSLDTESFDESLSSPHNLVKLLSESEKASSAIKMANSRKANNSTQSRFSFARQEAPTTTQTFGDSSRSSNAFQYYNNNRSYVQDFDDSRSSLVDKYGTGNNFSSNFEEAGAFSTNPLAFSPSKHSVQRMQISVPPGFSGPSRAPPPGFSSHERLDQNFEYFLGNHMNDLSRNAYHVASPGNLTNPGDIEFVDPAILAVGKGRLQGGLGIASSLADSRPGYHQPLSSYENDARLQLLMQRSRAPPQGLRFPDDSASHEPYGLASRRFLDSPQLHNPSQFSQLSLQQSRNGVASSGHWDGWNEIQGGGNLAMAAELLRNERMGLSKLYGGGGYDDGKFRLPSSGDLYNRGGFEM